MKYNYSYIYILLITTIILSSSPTNTAHAALKAKGSASLTEAYNPNPSSTDILLPMPCNMKMAFKIVAVPAQGFLWDMKTRLGQDEALNDQRGFYDSSYTASISAPFDLVDLPPAWQKIAPNGNFFYYFIGKYEISGLQWDAIMQKSCPTPSAENIRPKTNISWYDAVEFSQKYNQWLLKNYPKSLPQFFGDSRNIGFVRLPTETEWEYAARGGHTSTSQELNELDFFPIAQGESYADYAVFRPENTTRIEENAARIGSHKPNKLGLYDTAGNVAEMVMDMFRFSIGGRLHGSAGGFVRKGGSYLSGTAEILPGRRDEVAFFNIDGPLHAKDLGFRLVLSGLNTPGGQRPEILQNEWKNAGERNPLLLDSTKNPLEELDRLLSNTQNDVDRKNYQNLFSLIKDNNIALEKQQMLAATSKIRTVAFMLETAHKFSKRIVIVKNTQNNLEFLKKETKDETKLISINASLNEANSEIKELEQDFDQILQFYKTDIEDTQNINQSIFDQAIKKVQSELAKGDKFSQKLHGNVQLFAKHILAVRQKGVKNITVEQLKFDILNQKNRSSQ